MRTHDKELLGKPLTEAELDRLDSFLSNAQKQNPDVMGLEMLDGFLAALVTSPEIVLPSKGLPEVLGGESEILDVEEDAEEMIGLILRHWNTIADTLAKDDVYVPIFTEFDNEVPRGNNWAKGFMRGMDMRREAWSGLVQDDNLAGYVFPMMFLNYEHDPDPRMRPGPITPEKRWDLIGYLGAGLLRAYQHFKAERAQQAALLHDLNDLDEFEDDIPEPLVRAQPKTGRNDPCPCGSGKKYKRCHGAVTVL